MTVNTTPALEPIAIVGIACRLPGEASSPEGLWNLMSNSRTAHGPIPPSRWNAEAWYHPDADHKGTITTKSAFFLNQDVSAFDAPFFSTTAKEAAGMDPAKRMLLEVAYEAFENAGMSLTQISGTQTGVYVGSMTSDYELLSTADIMDHPHMAAAGSSEAMTANRLSWFFDFRGPSLTLDTACSSSLYALHLACQSLRLEETSMGLVAGVNLILHPNFMQQLTAMHMLSPDGTSHSFDDRANGYGRGEGIGALVVKRLADAIRDGDAIRAVIRATAANVDGKTPSVTMPSSQAQAQLIRTAYETAQLPLEDTEYVELHGTGTPLGDPIEVAAIAATFGASRASDRPIHIGSIKPNVGHTEGCAGIAGVLRAVLSVEKGLLLPTAGINVINPKLGLAQKNLAIPTATIPWPTSGVRRASVNSFGFGGANAHVIIDDAASFLRSRALVGLNGSLTGRVNNANGSVRRHGGLDEDTKTNFEYCTEARVNGQSSKCTPPKLLLFSSSEETGLDRLASVYRAHFAERPEAKGCSRDEERAYFERLAYTLAHRRTPFDHRSFVVADSLGQLQSELQNGLGHFRRPQGPMHGTAFVFTGQGAQWAGMGKELLAFPVFSQSIDQSNDCISSLGCTWDLRSELLKLEGSSIDQPAYSQPLCTAVQVGVVELLKDWNIHPKATVGHSSGEIAASFAAGILSHDDAMKVAYFRGVYSEMVAKGPRRGAMMAAGISESEAEIYLTEAHATNSPKSESRRAVVACINSPNSVTLSGDVDMIDRLETLIAKDNKFVRKLRVSTAYHSPHMRDIANECLAAMHKAGLCQSAVGPTSIKMFSSVIGKEIPASEVNAQYWIENMCQPVRFSYALEQLLLSSSNRSKQRSTQRPIRKGKAAINWNSIVEIGPHAALKGPIGQIMNQLNSDKASHPKYMAPVIRGEDAIQTALQTAGGLWTLGNDVSLSRVNLENSQKAQHILVDLPAYPWNHSKQHWHEALDTKNERLRKYPRLDLLGVRVDSTNSHEPQWRNQLRIKDNPWIGDHVITGTTLYPAAGMLIMVIEAAKQLALSEDRTVRGLEFENVFFERGLVVPGEGLVETILSVRRSKNRSDSKEFTILSRPSGEWIKHCSGSFTAIYDEVAAKDSTASQSSTLTPLDWEPRLEEFERKQVTMPSTTVDVGQLYEKLDAIGMEYGPYFQNLTSLEVWEGGACFGTVKIPDTKGGMPHGFEYDHIIHPATLDAIFHLALCAVAEHGSDLLEAAVPLRMERMFIATDLPSSAGQSFAGYAKRVSGSGRRMAADLIVSDDAWSGPKIIVEGLIVSQITAGMARGPKGLIHSEPTGNISRCARMAWNIDPMRLSPGTYSVNLLPTVSNMLTANSPNHQTELQAWIEAECHKSTELHVLLMGPSLDVEVLNQLGPFYHESSSSPYKGVRTLTITDTSTTSLGIWEAAYASTLATTKYPPTFLLANAKDPEPTQGGELFDIIIMNECELAEPSVQKVEDILKPGGRLVLLKQMNPPAEMLSVEEPHGADHGASYSVSVRVTSKASAPIPNNTEKLFLLLPDSEDVNSIFGAAAAAIAESLEKALKQHEFEVQRIRLRDITATLPSKASIISLLDCEGSLVTTWTEDQFVNFKSLLDKAKIMLWVTTGAQMNQPGVAECNSTPSTGLLRVLRNEYPHLSLCHLDLSTKSLSMEDRVSKLVVDEWFTVAAHTSEHSELESELAEQDGRIFVPRVISYDVLDEELSIATGKLPVRHALLGASAPLYLAETQSGTTTERLAWYPDESVENALGQGEVEIKVMAFSGMMDDYNDGPTAIAGHLVAKLGSQAVGIVTRRGTDVRTFKEGDLVIMYGGKGCRSHMRQHISLVLTVPDSIPVEVAATVNWIHAMASYVLTRIARLQEGDSILITNAQSSLLHLAILFLAKEMKLRVIASGTTQEDLKALEACGVCGKDLILLPNSGLKSYINHITNGRKLSAVFATPTDFSQSKDFWPCLVDFGCAVALVVTDADRNVEMPVEHHPTITFATLDPHQILTERPEAASRILHSAVGSSSYDWLAAAKPPTSFSAGQAEQLLSRIQTHHGHHNLFAVELKDEELVPVARTRVEPLCLDPSAAYILAGGYGSLGLRLAKSMVDHGARHLILLSRSGESSRHQDDIMALRNAGAKIEVLKCNVGLLTEVKAVFDDLTGRGIEIKGVVQGVMVLQDSLFATMTLEQWRVSITPKIQGTMNLHLASEGKPLDFFILLSSVVSVMGNMSQANYAAANSYMDAFAHYRRSIGLPAVSLNIGIVLDSGHVIDGTALDQYLDRFPHFHNIQTTLDEVDNGILAAMRGTMADGQSVQPQFMLGMTNTLDPEGVNKWARDSKFIHRIATLQDSNGSQTEESQSQSWRRRLGEVSSMQEAVLAAQAILQELVAPGLGIPSEEISPDKPLYNVGVDSFKAVEIRNQVFRDLESDLSVFEILSPKSLAELASLLAERSQIISKKLKAGSDSRDED